MEREQTNCQDGSAYMKDYIKLLRVKHYIKNLLILLPVFFGRSFWHIAQLGSITAAFIAFCFTSSCVYILNDIQDMEKDRNHPVKCKRPIASGRIPVKNATAVLVVLALISVLILVLSKIPLKAVGLLALYVILNILYSCGLKNIVLADIAILTSGFVLRVFYGSVVSDIPVSDWMYLTVLTASLYMALGKRRNELKKSAGDATRAVLEKYNYAFLDKCMYLSLTSALIFYSLWAILEFPGNYIIKFSIPLIIAISMLYSLIVEKDSDGDPVEVILGSKGLLILVSIFGVLMLACLYL